MEFLSTSEKERLARHLSYSATVGGWTFMGFGLFTAVLIALPLLGVLNNDITYEPELIGAFIPLLLAFFLPGFWLLRRRKIVRAQLDGELLPAQATVLALDHTDPTRGWYVNLEVTTPSLTVEEATLHSYGLPPWRVGDEIELLFLPENGRFFPRHLAHNSDMGRILTTQQRQTQRSFALILGIILGIFVVIGIVVSVISQLAGTP